MSRDVLQLVVNGLAQGSQLALLAFGFGLVYAVRRVFHVAYGAVFALACYCALSGVSWGGGRLWVGAFLGIMSAVLVTAILEQSAYRGLRMDSQSEWLSVPVSLGCYVVGVSLLALLYGSAPISLPQDVWLAPVRCGVVSVSVGQFGGIVAGLSVVAIGQWSRRGTLALVVRGVSEDGELAETVGISRRAVGLGAVLVSGLIAGTSAWLHVLDKSTTPTVGANVIAIGAFGLLGGPKDVMLVAPLVGLTIGVTQHVSAPLLPGPWREPAAFLLGGIVAAVWRLRPHGRAG